MNPDDSPIVHENDLVLSRLIAAPRAIVWRLWTDPESYPEWWCPKPWTTTVKAFDLRPGGAFHTFMQGPDGGTSDNPGCFLEIIPGERLVFTSSLAAGWRPATPWLPMTAEISLSDEAGGTRYVARVMHPDRETRDKHETMGFHDGWGTVADQLAELAKSLA